MIDDTLKAFNEAVGNQDLDEAIAIVSGPLNDIETKATLSPESVLMLETAISLTEKLKAARQDAMTDPLTQIPNRGYFDDQLENLVARVKRGKYKNRSGGMVALVMIDIDHFKRFNDDHGHQVGDAVLKKVAKRLEGGLRDGDMVARYGGEEFIAILQAENTGDMGAALKRISSLCSMDLSHEGKRYQVGNSMGAAVFSRRAMQGLNITPESFVKRADDKVYNAKDAGRGQMKCYAFLDQNGTDPTIEALP